MKNNLSIVCLTTFLTISSSNLNAASLQVLSKDKSSESSLIKQEDLNTSSKLKASSLLNLIKTHKKAGVVLAAVLITVSSLLLCQDKLGALLKLDDQKKADLPSLEANDDETAHSDDEANRIIDNLIEDVIDKSEAENNAFSTSSDIPSDDEDEKDARGDDYYSQREVAGSSRHACPNEEDDRHCEANKSVSCSSDTNNVIRIARREIGEFFMVPIDLEYLEPHIG
jgi:hypothetical protein